jgi:hypothetical protein
VDLTDVKKFFGTVSIMKNGIRKECSVYGRDMKCIQNFRGKFGRKRPIGKAVRR